MSENRKNEGIYDAYEPTQNEQVDERPPAAESSLQPESGEQRQMKSFSYRQPKKMWKRFGMAFLAGAIMLGGWGYALGDRLGAWADESGVEVLGQAFTPDKDQAKQSDLVTPVVRPNTIAEMVKQAGPAVVKINTYGTNEGGGPLNPFMADPFFREFFGDRLPAPGGSEQSQGLGTGFIISKDGYVVTNQHVIQGADRIEVSVEGYEKPLGAKLVGADFELDLAILKVEASKDLPSLKMGESSGVMVGDWVVAIGNPYGYDHTVTVGVISAKGRPVGVQDRQYKNLLQTDASINPGNSGGPLLNLEGEVVGINTAVSAQAQGIGFAIPTSTVQSVLEQLIDDGKVIRPWLGVQIQTLNQEIADYFKLDKAEGAIVVQVVPNSPAAKAGLQRGDVILEVNGDKTPSADKLVEQVKSVKVGDKVMLLIQRQGSQQFVTIKVEEKPTGVH
jgi:serine protease Do